MEPGKRVVALLPGGIGALPAKARTARVALRLLPQLPFGAELVVDLFKGEIAPGNLQLVAKLLLRMMQQDRCRVDIGSGVVVPDLQRQWLGH